MTAAEHRRGRRALLVLFSLSSTASLATNAGCDGCNERKPSVKEAAPIEAGAKPLRNRPKNAAELPTTSEEIYLGNLDGQILELTRLVNEAPSVTQNLVRLSASRHTRGRYRGDLDEIQAGIDGATRCIEREPENGACYLLRAEQEQSLHRFKAARADLARARTLGEKDPARSADAETELDWNDGLYDKAIAGIRRARQERPSTNTWLREAQLEHDLGNDDASDRMFEAAEDLITDTAPLPVAHLNVQRGIQKVARGQLEEACIFFREAIARMPTYVAGLDHLAETLAMLGNDDEAIALYEKVTKLTDDPEFTHALGVLYAKKGKSAEGRALVAKAKARYEALLAKYPEAMYWHAAEFFSSIKEPQRARELLEKNVGLRPNSVSYVALARAELENGHVPEAKAAIDKALAAPVVSASLFWTASRIARAAGDTATADAHAARAKRLNPRIDRAEP